MPAICRRLLKRRSRHFARKRRLFARRERAGEVVGEAGAIFGGRVIAQPEIGIAAGVGAIPVQIVLRRVELFLRRGQDVALDQAVQRAIGEMIGEVEHDPFGEQLLNRVPQPLVQLGVVKFIRRRKL